MGTSTKYFLFSFRGCPPQQRLANGALASAQVNGGLACCGHLGTERGTTSGRRTAWAGLHTYILSNAQAHAHTLGRGTRPGSYSRYPKGLYADECRAPAGPLTVLRVVLRAAPSPITVAPATGGGPTAATYAGLARTTTDKPQCPPGWAL